MVRFLAPRPARNKGEWQWVVVVFRPVSNGQARKSVHWFATRFAAAWFIDKSCEEIRKSHPNAMVEIDAQPIR